MLSVSNDFKTAIGQTGRTLEVTVTVNGITYATSDVVKLKYQHGVLPDRFMVGQTPSAYLEVVLKNVTGDVDNKTVTASIGVLLPSGSYEYATLGTFTVDESVKNQKETTLKCFDKMVQLEVENTSTSTSLQTRLNEIVGAGVITLPSYLTSLTVTPTVGKTKRQELGYIASLCGAIAVVGRDNTYKFVTFPTTPSTSTKQTITSDIYFKLDREDKEYNITKVTLSDGTTSYTDGSVTSTTGFDLYIETPFAQSGIVDDIRTVVNNMPVTSYSLEFIGNPSLEIGDNVRINEFIEEGTEVPKYVNVYSMELNYDGGLVGTLSNVGEGKNKNSYGTYGEVQSAVVVAQKTADNAQISATNAQTTADTALTSANGKNRVYYQASTPSGGTYIVGDTWFDTDDNNRIYRYDGSTWTSTQLGTNAIADSAINNAKIANLDAGKITTGSLSANRISAGSITVDKLQIGDFTNLCQINPDGFTRNSTVITHTDSYKYFQVGQAAYSRIEVIKSETTEFKLNDEYYVSLNGWKDATFTGSVVFYARYFYSDGTYNNAGVVSLTFPTTLGTVSGTLKITTAQTATKTLDYVVFCLEKDGTTTGYFYARAIEIRKRYNGSLIVDGSITATNIAANTISADKIATNTITAASGVIADGAITNAKIADATIDKAKIASIDAGSITAGTLNANRIGVGSITVDKVSSTFGSDLNISSNSSVTIMATKDYVASRGENLVTNGTGLLGNNTNFSSFTYDKSDSYNVTGSFKDSSYNSTRFTDELIPVDVSKQYKMSVWAKCNPYVGAKYYAGIASYDSDLNLIQSFHHMYFANSTTTLAQDLKPGDTQIILTSSANWINSAGTSTWNRSIIFWSYKNSGGYQFPEQTYSRYVQLNAWNDGGINYTTHTITLSSPWSYSNPNHASGWWTAGTKVSNGSSGGAYKYITMSNATIPSTWTNYTGVIGSVDYSGTNSLNKFPPATSAIKLLFLNNRDVTGSTVWYSNISFSIDTVGTNEIVNKINVSTEGITIQANKISLLGTTNISDGAITNAKIDRVSANKLQVVDADIVSLTANKLTAGLISTEGWTTNYPTFSDVVINIAKENIAFVNAFYSSTVMSIGQFDDSMNIVNYDGTMGMAIGNSRFYNLADSSGNLTDNLRIGNVGYHNIEQSPLFWENYIEILENGNINFVASRDAVSCEFTFGDGLSEYMKINSSGNVGIGTSSPDNALTIIGNARVNNGSDSVIYLDNIGSYNQYLLANNTSKYLVFATNGSERMRIDSSGNFMVGTTSATNHRFNKSNAGAYAMTINNTAGVGSHGLQIYSPNSNDATGILLKLQDAGGDRATFYGNGNAKISGDYLSDKDVAWTNLTYATGFTAGTAGQLKYRVKNGIVYIIGGATGTFTNSTYHTITATALPTAYRPTQTIRVGAAGSGARSAIFEVNSSGHILVASNEATMPTWIGSTISYPIG